MHKVFSIAIPTFNRVDLLKSSLAAAREQTYPATEVVVCDNASTDNTGLFVRSLVSEVKYHRNDTNIGCWPNFIKAFALCSGKYFSWLQDDDLIHQDFATRAVSAFESSSNVKAYIAFALYSSNPRSHINPSLWGPPFALEWFKKTGSSIIPGSVVTPLSLFMTVGFCPTAAFERSSLLPALAYASKPYFLLTERTILAKAVCKGNIAVEPFIAGLFRRHSGQVSAVVKTDKDIELNHWILMTKDLAEIAEEIGPVWKSDFAGILPSIDIEHRTSWAIKSLSWPIETPFCIEARSILFDSLPAAVLDRIESRRGLPKPVIRFKNLIKQVCPPLIISLFRRLRSA
jgi:hypothetical protein